MAAHSGAHNRLVKGISTVPNLTSDPLPYSECGPWAACTHVQKPCSHKIRKNDGALDSFVRSPCIANSPSLLGAAKSPVIAVSDPVTKGGRACQDSPVEGGPIMHSGLVNLYPHHTPPVNSREEETPFGSSCQMGRLKRCLLMQIRDIEEWKTDPQPKKHPNSSWSRLDCKTSKRTLPNWGWFVTEAYLWDISNIFEMYVYGADDFPKIVIYLAFY